MQNFLNDLQLVSNYIQTQLSSLSDKKRETVDAQLRDASYPAGAQAFTSNEQRSIRKLGRAYNNDLTEQSEVDYKSIYKLVLAFVTEGALQPILVADQGGNEYIVSGRHRTLALAYLACVNHGEAFLDQTVHVTTVRYHGKVRLDQAIIGANDSRRVRPTERTQMKLSQAGLSTIEALTSKPGKVLLKGLVAREVADNYEGDLSPVTVQKLSDKFVQLLGAHTVFKLSAKPTPNELATLTRYCTEFGEWLTGMTDTLYRDYGNVARSVSAVGAKYESTIGGLLDELLDVEEIDDEEEQPVADEPEVIESAPPAIEAIDFDVVEL